MKIRISKNAERQIGGLRVSPEVFAKLEVIAKKEKVSKQEVIRAILDEVIDTIEI
mgnify:CR=1 FL=1